MFILSCRAGCTITARAKLSSPRRHPLLLCAGCKKAAYCSRECQIIAWTAGHQDDCGISRHVAEGAGAGPAVRRAAPLAYSIHQRRTVIHLQERRQMGDWRGGERMQREVLEVAAKVEKAWPEGAMSVYNNLALCFQFAGQYQRALALHQRHLAITIKVRDRGGEGAASCNIGNCLDSLGQHESALEYHETSLVLAMEVADKDGEGGCCGNLANVKESLGQSGHEMRQQLLSVAKEAGEMSMFGDLNKVSSSLGQYAQALALPRADPVRACGAGGRGQGPSLGNLGAREGHTYQNVPRELVLLAEARATAAGQWSWELGDVGGKNYARPRAILSEVGAGDQRPMQPRDLSLILAGAFRKGYPSKPAPPEKKAGEGAQKAAQRAKKFRGLSLTGPIAVASTESRYCLGKLILRVLSCQDLLAADSNGTSDPFVDIFYSNIQKGKQTRKTSVKYKTRNPVWEEEFPFNVWNVKDKIELKVFDNDDVGGNDFLGRTLISMSQVFTSAKEDKLDLGESPFKVTEIYELQGFMDTEFVDAECTLRVKGTIKVELSYEALPPPTSKPNVAAADRNGHGAVISESPRKRALPQKPAPNRSSKSHVLNASATPRNHCAFMQKPLSQKPAALKPQHHGSTPNERKSKKPVKQHFVYNVSADAPVPPPLLPMQPYAQHDTAAREHIPEEILLDSFPAEMPKAVDESLDQVATPVLEECIPSSPREAHTDAGIKQGVADGGEETTNNPAAAPMSTEALAATIFKKDADAAQETVDSEWNMDADLDMDQLEFVNASKTNTEAVACGVEAGGANVASAASQRAEQTTPALGADALGSTQSPAAPALRDSNQAGKDHGAFTDGQETVNDAASAYISDADIAVIDITPHARPSQDAAESERGVVDVVPPAGGTIACAAATGGEPDKSVEDEDAASHCNTLQHTAVHCIIVSRTDIPLAASTAPPSETEAEPMEAAARIDEENAEIF